MDIDAYVNQWWNDRADDDEARERAEYRRYCDELKADEDYDSQKTEDYEL